MSELGPLWWAARACAGGIGVALLLVGVFTSWQSPAIAVLFFLALAALAGGWLGRRLFVGDPPVWRDRP